MVYRGKNKGRDVWITVEAYKRRLEYQKKYQKSPDGKALHRRSYQKHREKRLAHTNNWRKENRDIFLQQRREYRAKNRERMNAYRRARHPQDYERSKDKRKAYKRERRARDPKARLVNNIRSRIGHVLSGRRKSKRTMEILGCDFETARKWLGSTMVKEWEGQNMHVDHYLPICCFDFDHPDAQRVAFNFRNLRWLPAAHNLTRKKSLPEDWRERFESICRNVGVRADRGMLK